MHTARTRTTLILLPGLDGTDIFFAPLLRYLPAWIEPVVITYPPDGNNTYDALLSLVMQKVSGLESFAILGWSFGGPLALMVAAKLPAQVQGVILCGSFVSPPHRWLVPLRFALVPPVVWLIRALRRTRLLLPGYASPELRQAKAATWRSVNARALAARAQTALEVDARPLLRACNAKLMYMAASRDEVIARSHPQEICAIAPHAQLVEIEGPHLAMFTNPAQSAACIAGFMQALRRKRI